MSRKPKRVYTAKPDPSEPHPMVAPSCGRVPAPAPTEPYRPDAAYRPDVLGARAALIRAVTCIDDALTATQSAELTWDLRAVKRRLQDLLAKVG